MSTLYLYIGTPKTATTSLQMFCDDNQEILNQKGYSYPILDFRFPHVAIRRNGHFIVGKIFDEAGNRDSEKEEAVWKLGIDMLHEELKKYSNVILSDENIWNASRGEKFAQWEKLKEDAKQYHYDIKVIVYLRRQDTFINSWLSQQVKEGWNTNSCIKWDSFIHHPRKIILDYYSHLEKIAQVIGRENIIVRVFEREQFQGTNHTIFSDFLEAIGLEYSEEYVIGEEEANKSLTANSQEIARIMNPVVPNEVSLQRMVRRAAAVCEETKDPNNSFVMFSKEEGKEFLKKYEAGNAAIAKEYLGREDGILFSDKMKEGPRWTPQNEYMQEDIIRFFGNIVMEQQQQIQELWQTVWQMKDSREESLKDYLQGQAGEIFPPDSRVDEREPLASEVLLAKMKEFQTVADKMKKYSEIDNKQFRMTQQIRSLKNEIADLNRKLDEQKNEWTKKQKKMQKQLEELQQSTVLYRLKRKTKHVLGKDK